jgi:hypothetical protein
MAEIVHPHAIRDSSPVADLDPELPRPLLRPWSVGASGENVVPRLLEAGRKPELFEVRGDLWRNPDFALLGFRALGPSAVLVDLAGGNVGPLACGSLLLRAGWDRVNYTSSGASATPGRLRGWLVFSAGGGMDAGMVRAVNVELRRLADSLANPDHLYGFGCECGCSQKVFLTAKEYDAGSGAWAEGHKPAQRQAS